MSKREPPAPAPKQTPEEVLSSPGHPLDPGSRADMEARFGRDFSSVRIHTDARAAESAEAVSAHAYTVGSHVVFGAGRFVPNTRAGRHLLAHELTHTIQQSSRPLLQRQALDGAVETPAEAEAEQTADQVTASPGGFIVDDDAATSAPGQMRRSEFLSDVTRAACAAADVVMAGGGQSTEGCPYVDDALARAKRMSTSQLETAVRRFIDPEGVTSAADYIPRIGARVAEGVLRYLLTGDTSAVPADLASAPGEEAVAPAMQFKREGSGDATASDANRAASELGRGAPLDGPVRTRMEHAFGFDFSRVRIHTDARAAAASSALSARAFTIGNNVAFAGNEYRPNTLIGDALLAHELAHVVQQNGGVHAKGGASDALDDDADRSAVGAVMRIWTGAKDVAASAMPRLRSGLQLQRCKSEPSEADLLAKTIHDLLEATPLDEAAVLASISAINRDAAKATALRRAYKSAFKTELEDQLKAKLSADGASRALFFLNAPLAETGTKAGTTVVAAGTEKHTAKVPGGDVSVRTGVDYGAYRGGYSVGYTGTGAPESRLLQMLWSEVVSTQPDGTKLWVNKTGIVLHDAVTMDLTIKPGPEKYHVDSLSNDSPFYEAAATAIRTSTGTTMYDRPSEFVDIIHKQFDAGATKVVERDHFDVFLVQENKPVYQVSMLVEWVYTSKTAVVRTTNFGSGGAVSALPTEIKKQLVKEFPKYEYIR